MPGFNPLRGFQIVSNPLVFSGLSSDVAFPTRTQNFTRAAIIGIEAVTPSPIQLLRYALNRFDVAGRQIKQGDDVALGLLASGAEPALVAAGAQVSKRRSYFPGETLPLSDGNFCAGALLNGRENITIRVTKALVGDDDITRIVLHCLEFPRGAYPRGVQDRVDELWDKFQAGVGQFHCFGNEYALTAGAPLQTTLEARINPPHTMRSRRRELRGVQYDSDDGAGNESEFVTATAQVYGDESNATQTSNQGVPARELIGHANLHHTDEVTADFERDSRSLCLFVHPAPAETGVGRIVTLFEGSDNKGIKICGPAVF